MKRLASSLAKKTSSVMVPPPCMLWRIAPAVTATESTLPGPKRDGSVNGRDTVRSVCPTPPGTLNENASRLSGRRKLSTSTLRTTRDAAHAASATPTHTVPSATALRIVPPQLSPAELPGCYELSHMLNAAVANATGDSPPRAFVLRRSNGGCGNDTGELRS